MPAYEYELGDGERKVHGGKFTLRRSSGVLSSVPS